MPRAIYPGSFDPIHYGHIDIAQRASLLFDELLLAVFDAPAKKLLFTTEERMDMAAEALAHLPNVSIVSYTGLTVECARKEKAQVVIRGLRNVADFGFEQQIGWANNHMMPDIELCCFFCHRDYSYLSATILKEVAGLGGDYSQWTSPYVQQALQGKFGPAKLSSKPESDASNVYSSSKMLTTRNEGKLARRD